MSRKLLCLAATALLGAACSSSSSPTSNTTHLAYDSLPVTAATVQAAVATFTTAPDSVRSSCVGSLTVNCPGGAPGAPIPLLTSRIADSVSQTSAGVFGFEAHLVMGTLVGHVIPVTVPIVGNCTATWTGTAGADSTIQVWGRAVFGSQVAGSDTDRIDVTADSVTGFEQADFAISGTNCTLTNAVYGAIRNSIAAAIYPQGNPLHLCGAPGAAEFVACTPGVPLATVRARMQRLVSRAHDSTMVRVRDGTGGRRVSG